MVLGQTHSGTHCKPARKDLGPDPDTCSDKVIQN